MKVIQELPDTADDKALTKEQIIANLKKNSKSSGGNGLTSDILIRSFQVFLCFSHKYTTHA